MKAIIALIATWIVGAMMIRYAQWENGGGCPESTVGWCGIVICGITSLLLVALPFIRLIEWLCK